MLRTAECSYQKVWQVTSRKSCKITETSGSGGPFAGSVCARSGQNRGACGATVALCFQKTAIGSINGHASVRLLDIFFGSAMRCNSVGEKYRPHRWGCPKTEEWPKIGMVAKAGSQEKQSQMDSRFRGNDAGWRLLDGSHRCCRFGGWVLFILHGIGLPLTAEYESEKQHAPLFNLSGIPSNR